MPKLRECRGRRVEFLGRRYRVCLTRGSFSREAAPSRNEKLNADLPEFCGSLQSGATMRIAHGAIRLIRLLVDHKLVVESKASERLPRDFARQLYNYLKATPFEVGLFLHFGRRADFYRVVLQNEEKPRRDEAPLR